MFVYVITAASGIVKIGIARNIRRRLAALQVGQPFPLRVVHSIEVGHAKNAALIEARAHYKLARYRLQGEWFRIEHSRAIAMLERVARAHARIQEEVARSEIELQQRPGTVTHEVYCPQCFHHGNVLAPAGKWRPRLRCSHCGNTNPLIAGRDHIRPWRQAKRKRGL